MTTICAWCNSTIRETQEESLEIDHGICDDCHSMIQRLIQSNRGDQRSVDSTNKFDSTHRDNTFY
jgi:hypothetical protein